MIRNIRYGFSMQPQVYQITLRFYLALRFSIYFSKTDSNNKMLSVKLHSRLWQKLPCIYKAIPRLLVPCKIKCDNLYTNRSVSKLGILVLLYIYMYIYTQVMYNQTQAVYQITAFILHRQIHSKNITQTGSEYQEYYSHMRN